MILGFHCHFPLALSEQEFETLYRNKLMPLIRAIHKHPAGAVTIHFSGSLLYRIERLHSEFFTLLSKLVDRKQVELLGGGFYEPMLPLVQQSDRLGQIELLTTYLRKHFDKRVTGCLIPPETWDTGLVSSLSNSGMAYTFLPSGFFSGSYLKSAAGLLKPFITEDNGKSMVIFPIQGTLDNEYLTSDLRAGLESIVQSASTFPEEDGCPAAALFPGLDADLGGGKNAEKIFNTLFELLEEYKDRVELTHGSKIIEEPKPLSKIYIRGGGFKSYFTEYPESANLYSKTVWTKRIIDQIRGDKPKKESAAEELWKAQGYRLYCKTDLDESDIIVNPAMRGYAYQSLIFAEKLVMGAMFTRDTILSKDDFDFDGDAEYIFHGCKINAYIHRRGAFIFELDYVFKPWNYLSIFAEREGELSFRKRGIFMDKLCSGQDGFFGDCRDLSREYYQVTKYIRTRAKLTLELPQAENAVPFAGITVEKKYHVNENHIEVRWTLTNKGAEAARFYFVSEVNLAFPCGGGQELRIFSYDTYTKGGEEKTEKKQAAHEHISLSDIQAVEFHDLRNETLLRLSSLSLFDARIYQVKSKITTARTKQEIEFYQATCVETSRYMEIEAGAQAAFQFTLGIY
jgi:hypothetical protein